jgi:hypothetical protein
LGLILVLEIIGAVVHPVKERLHNSLVAVSGRTCRTWEAIIESQKMLLV